MSERGDWLTEAGEDGEDGEGQGSFKMRERFSSGPRLRNRDSSGRETGTSWNRQEQVQVQEQTQGEKKQQALTPGSDYMIFESVKTFAVSELVIAVS